MRSLPLVLLLFAATSAAQVVPHHLTEADRPHATPPAIPRDAIHAPRVESLQRSRAMRTPVAPRLVGGRSILTVNSAYDEPDEDDTDGVCSTSYGECTLRAAMEQAEALAPVPVTIEFDLTIGPEGSYDPSTGAWRIAPNLDAGAGTYGSLPFMRRSDLIIDGLTQTGAACGDLLEGLPHDLRIIVDGRYLPYPEDGFDFGYVDAIQITGLVIQNMPGAGVQGTFTNSTIRCNYLGTTRDGQSAAPNIFGIDYTNTGSQPTGPLLIENNLISGNQNHGVILREHRGAVLRNLIGTTASGDAPLPNGIDGVVNFGRDAEIDANVISANGMHGIRISAPTPEIVPANNRITNNWIGLSRLGMRNGLGNGHTGLVSLTGPSPEVVATDLHIGGPGDPNTFGDNGHLAGPGEPAGGISLWGGNRVTVSGNVIGLDATGAAAPNIVGIEIDGRPASSLQGVTIG
ncbi:MAG TPA: right-handed parallel beta-helix repeat-containing protein, partial [Bacteroidetes bacterium]|nr:right-handed parallel beta-helix repeat-containing protein [Bacteroidota bacterium]